MTRADLESKLSDIVRGLSADRSMESLSGEAVRAWQAVLWANALSVAELRALESAATRAEGATSSLVDVADPMERVLAVRLGAALDAIIGDGRGCEVELIRAAQTGASSRFRIRRSSSAGETFEREIGSEDLEALREQIRSCLGRRTSLSRQSGSTGLWSSLLGSDEPPYRPGDVVDGRYRVERIRGGGGFGWVYEVTDLPVETRFALKLLKPERDEDSGAFQREAQRLARLRHPNVVQYNSFGWLEDGQRFLVMELVDGESLAAVLEREGPLPWRRVAGIVLQVLDALRAAHSHPEGQILHLDLKPSNVLVDGSTSETSSSIAERVKVVDFGVDHDGERCTACTPGYAAPEQLECAKLDGRSDLFALGALAYELLTGTLAPRGTSSRRLWSTSRPASRTSTGSTSRSRVSGPMRRFVARLLAHDPGDRFESADDAHGALRSIVRPIGRKLLVVTALAFIVLLVVSVSRWRSGVPGVLDGLSGFGPGLESTQDLSGQSIHLYPGRERVALTWSPKSSTARADVRFELVEERAGSFVRAPGVEITAEPDSHLHRLSIRAVEPILPRRLERVRVRLVEGWSSRVSAPFRIELGSPPDTSWLDASLGPAGETVRVDPIGFPLVVPEPLSRGLWFSVGLPGNPGPRTAGTSDLGALIFSSLDDRRESWWTIELFDVGGRLENLSRSIEIVEGRFDTSRAFRWIDARERTIWSASEHPTLLCVMDVTRPKLELEFSRPVEVEGELEIDGEAAPLPRARSILGVAFDPARQVRFDPWEILEHRSGGALIDRLVAERATVKIRVRASEESHVLCNPSRRDERRAEYEFAILLLPSGGDLTWSVSEPEARRSEERVISRRDLGEIRLELPADGPWTVALEDAESVDPDIEVTRVAQTSSARGRVLRLALEPRIDSDRRLELVVFPAACGDENEARRLGLAWRERIDVDISEAAPDVECLDAWARGRTRLARTPRALRVRFLGDASLVPTRVVRVELRLTRPGDALCADFDRNVTCPVPPAGIEPGDELRLDLDPLFGLLETAGSGLIPDGACRLELRWLDGLGRARSRSIAFELGAPYRIESVLPDEPLSSDASRVESSTRSMRMSWVPGAASPGAASPGEEGFYLDEREVTVEEFRRFLRSSSGFVSRETWTGLELDATEASLQSRRTTLLARLEDRMPDEPIAGVSWFEAAAYARWAGKRLPSREEVESLWSLSRESGRKRAEMNLQVEARESNGRVWPVERGADLLEPGDGRRWRNLHSNVSEWSATVSERTFRWVLGGAFSVSDEFQVRSRDATYTEASIGFRCAADARRVVESVRSRDAGDTAFRLLESDER